MRAKLTIKRRAWRNGQPIAAAQKRKLATLIRKILGARLRAIAAFEVAKMAELTGLEHDLGLLYLKAVSKHEQKRVKRE